jgi:hypothetical protein
MGGYNRYGGQYHYISSVYRLLLNNGPLEDWQNLDILLIEPLSNIGLLDLKIDSNEIMIFGGFTI